MERKLANVAVIFVVWSFCCGCVTKRLWEENAFNEPSSEPNVRFYYSEPKDDVLVVYDELREASSSVCRRSYYLEEFAKLRGATPKPAFIDPSATNQLNQIPVLAKTDARSAAANSFAVMDEKGMFSVIVNGERRGPYELPVYPSGFHQGTQIALTPAAVAADTVIAGTVVGLIIWAAHGFDTVH